MATHRKISKVKIWKTADLLPKVNSAKCHDENRVYIHPVAMGNDDKAVCLDGWQILGCCEAPWASSDERVWALVYEKLSEENSGSWLDTFHSFKPGIYWGHVSDLKRWQFRV